MKKFTLLELLIVIAIIGILASLLLPSLSKARLKAQQAVCLSNKRQVGIAVLSYASSNNSFAPQYDNNKNWLERLEGNYLPERVSGQPQGAVLCPNGYKVTGPNKSNTALNKYITGNEWGLLGIRMSKATASETMMNMDNYKWWKRVDEDQMTNAYLINEAENSIARHFRKANIIFIDGHGIAKNLSFLLSKTDRLDTFWNPEL